MKRIAVLMTTYNGEQFVEEQIESILNQKCDYQIDLIVRDDGSKDTTITILKKYAKAGKIKFSAGKNIGAGYGFLKMLQDTPNYDYYAFSDQDDFWYEDKLQKGIDKIKGNTNYALYCSNAEMCNETLKTLGRNVHKNMSFFNAERVYLGLACAQGCTCIFNKQLAKVIQAHPMPEDIVLHDSFVTCLCFAIGGYFYADDWTSMKYRMHGKNIGGLVTRSQSGMIAIIKKRISYIIEKPEKSVVKQLGYISTAISIK